MDTFLPLAQSKVVHAVSTVANMLNNNSTKSQTSSTENLKSTSQDTAKMTCNSADASNEIDHQL